jgi:membrane fusion protein (multidrug efflux system)
MNDTTELTTRARVAESTIVLAAGAALVLGAAVWYLALRPAPGPASASVAENPPVAVLMSTVVVGPAADTFQAVGTLLADESVVIRSEIAGRIASLHIDEGGAVTGGQVLARLADEEWAAIVRQNEATLALQELKMRRAVELRDRNVMSQQEYDETLAALDQARATLALARARLDKTVIRAPFAGILGLRRVSPGDYVEAGEDLVNLEAINPLKVDFSVPERFALRLAPGQSVSVRVNAFPGEVFTGEVYAIDPRIDAATRSFLLRARIANPDARLRPGMFADAGLVLEVREDALWVPEQAIVPVGEAQYVYVVEHGKARRVPVQLGLRRPGEVEIVSGIAPGASVVSEGHQKLFDGAAVVPAPPPPAVAP